MFISHLASAKWCLRRLCSAHCMPIDCDTKAAKSFLNYQNENNLNRKRKKNGNRTTKETQTYTGILFEHSPNTIISFDMHICHVR